VYPEVISECANTIISQLHDSLILLSKKKKLPEIGSTFDNHSTQKCYTLLEGRCIRGYIPDIGEFHILFQLAGHTKNRLDQMNSPISQRYIKSESIETCNELVTMINQTGPHSATVQRTIYDWTSFFRQHINRTVTGKLAISAVHQVYVSHRGVKTKLNDEGDWSSWRSGTPSEKLEPVSVLVSFPDSFPSLIQIPALTEPRKNQLADAFGDINKVERIMDEYTNRAVDPFIELPIPFNSIPPINLLQDNINNVIPITIDGLPPDDPIEIELQVKAILDRKLEDGIYLWKTQWVDDTTTWEPESSFIAENGVNEIWDRF